MKFLSVLRSKVVGFAKREEGASAIEYAVLAGIIIAALAFFGTGLRDAFNTSSGNIEAAITTAPGTDPE